MGLVLLSLDLCTKQTHQNIADITRGLDKVSFLSFGRFGLKVGNYTAIFAVNGKNSKPRLVVIVY